MPRVSVVIPFHNRIDWVAEALQSVLNQTYRDFEIILVDDGSDDSIPLKMIEDSRIKYVRQENKGASAARNCGISLARGKYVAFLDADDLFVPLKLEKQVAYMDAHPKIHFTHTSYQRITREGDDLEVMHSGEFSGRINREVVFNCRIATPTVMMTREALGEKLRFDESLQVGQGEDVIFWLLFATTSEVGGLDEPLTKVRMHGGNVSLDPESQMVAKMNTIKYVIDENPALAFALPRWSRSSLFLEVAHIYLQQGDRRNYHKYLKRSMTVWPINLLVYKELSMNLRSKVLYEIRKVTRGNKYRAHI